MSSIVKATSLEEQLSECIANMEVINQALNLYKEDYGEYPSTLDELMPRYLKAIPCDPFTDKPFNYTFDGKFVTLTPEIPRELNFTLEVTSYGIIGTFRGVIASSSLRPKMEDKYFSNELIAIGALRNIATALEMYRNDKGHFPDSLQLLISEKYLYKLPVDPETNLPYIYEFDKEKDEFNISVPESKKYNLEKFLYSSKEGIIRK